MRNFFHTMKALTSYHVHVSATLIVIENRNNGQSWWRRIQTLGMSEDYKYKNSAIYKWLLVLFFGLSLLPSDEVGTAFANEIMFTIPADDRCRKFADDIVDHYIDSVCEFAPDLWAASPQQSPTTTNAAAESFHSHLNADIQTPHSNIYVFLQSFTRQQASTYILTGSLTFTRAPSRTRRVFILCIRLTLTLLRFWRYELRFY